MFVNWSSGDSGLQLGWMTLVMVFYHGYRGLPGTWLLFFSVLSFQGGSPKFGESQLLACFGSFSGVLHLNQGFS